ncbi:MAG: ATP-binding cassette domain-containing protein, partial [Acidimicrobiales bacterium]
MASAVRFRSAVALAGSYPVLAGLDLEVEAGEVVALRGANGAGKTSVLRACAGLLAVTAGEAVVLGVALCGAERAGQAAMSGLRRRIGLLGHVTGLYDDLTVEANVTFALRAAGAGGRSGEGAARAGAAIERMGLGGRLATT